MGFKKKYSFLVSVYTYCCLLHTFLVGTKLKYPFILFVKCINKMLVLLLSFFQLFSIILEVEII